MLTFFNISHKPVKRIRIKIIMNGYTNKSLKQIIVLSSDWFSAYPEISRNYKCDQINVFIFMICASAYTCVIIRTKTCPCHVFLLLKFQEERYNLMLSVYKSVSFSIYVFVKVTRIFTVSCFSLFFFLLYINKNIKISEWGAQNSQRIWNFQKYKRLLENFKRLNLSKT